jgi:V/A-type H+-transporting ATPase subunit K
MEDWTLILGWIGVFAPVALGAVGSSIGCTRAGQAACGAMLDQEGGYGRFVAVSAFPASQTIYGIVVTMVLNADGVTIETAPLQLGVGVLAGLGIMVSAIGQGMCCAAAINSFKNKPEVFGLSVAPAAFTEGFAIFVLAFALVVAGKLDELKPEAAKKPESTSSTATATDN